MDDFLYHVQKYVVVNNHGDICLQIDIDDERTKGKKFSAKRTLFVFEHHRVLDSLNNNKFKRLSSSVHDDEFYADQERKGATRFVYAATHSNDNIDNYKWNGMNLTSKYLLLWTNSKLKFIEIDPEKMEANKKMATSETNE